MAAPSLEIINKSLALMWEKHAGQRDKADADYRLHPIRVSNRCVTAEAKVVALLHDIIEDTDVTADQLLEQGFTEAIVDAILDVTRKEGESYRDFIVRAGSKPISKEVKIADLQDNLDIFRLKEISEKDRLRLNKYLHSYRYLSSNNTDELKLICEN